jgi:hypothetical protein
MAHLFVCFTTAVAGPAPENTPHRFPHSRLHNAGVKKIPRTKLQHPDCILSNLLGVCLDLGPTCDSGAAYWEMEMDLGHEQTNP